MTMARGPPFPHASQAPVNKYKWQTSRIHDFRDCTYVETTDVDVEDPQIEQGSAGQGLRLMELAFSATTRCPSSSSISMIIIRIRTSSSTMNIDKPRI